MSDPIDSLPVADLLIFNNCLNEICNGVHIEDSEFQTRLGVERDQVRELLARINARLRNTGGQN